MSDNWRLSLYALGGVWLLAGWVALCLWVAAMIWGTMRDVPMWAMMLCILLGVSPLTLLPVWHGLFWRTNSRRHK